MSLVCVELIKLSTVPILGVCLGHQSIGAAFGGNIVKAPEIFHGKTSKINHDGSLLFSDIENSYEVVRYHKSKPRVSARLLNLCNSLSLNILTQEIKLKLKPMRL